MLIHKFKTIVSFILTLTVLSIWLTSTILVVYADTDGSELKTTKQPDKLVLKLGDDFAGAEFELKLDSGVFPVPIKADKSGTLTMELGGSKTYTLTRIKPVSIPEPINVITSPPVTEDIFNTNSETSEISIESISADTTEIDTEPDNNIPGNSIPLPHLIFFIGGIILIVVGFFVIRALKKRREYYDDDDEDTDYNEYDDDE